MKLISCYIENFGNISKRTFDFDKGLTSLCEKNGYGKTTLAAFLKSVFYGMKTTRAGNFDDRKHYYPFEGGKFGGNVLFEKDGVQYKIERFFDKKSETADTFALYKNGSAQKTDEKFDAGKEFFGVDEQSFLRTVFVSSADTESGVTADIGRMLSGFVDDANYEKAKALLEERKKNFKAGRGDKGKIADKKREIVALEERIKNKQTVSDGLDEKYRQRAKVTAEIDSLEKRRKEQRERDLKLQQWSTYDGYVSDAAAEKEKLEEILSGYPKGLPTAEEASAFREQTDRERLIEEKLKSLDFSEEKESRLAAFKARFIGGVPTDEDIRSANERAANVIKLEAEADNCKAYLDGLKTVTFPAGVPDKDEVEKYFKKLAATRESSRPTSVKNNKKVTIILAFLAFVLLGAGAGIMAVNFVAGGIVLALGVVGILAAIFVYFKGQINGIKSGAPQDDNEIASFLVRCGYYSGAGVEVDFNNLTRDLQEYNSVAADREKYQRQLSEKQALKKDEQEKLNGFLNKYGFAGGNADLTNLGALTAEYAALNAEKADIKARTDESRAQLEECKKHIQTFVNKYALVLVDKLAERVERDAAEAERLKNSIERLVRRAEDYKKQNALDIRPDCGGEENLDERITSLREDLRYIDADILTDETEAESLDELKEKLKTAWEEEKNFTKKYLLLDKCLSLLKSAEDNLKDRYIKPIKDVFVKYGEPLEKALGEKVSFDKNFVVKFERGGEERSDRHLSAGQKSLCALCLRLALIDNMYKGNPPFIIMDDPFVHLDGEHMKRAEKLIKELASNRQIIYFCCHESRKI